MQPRASSFDKVKPTDMNNQGHLNQMHSQNPYGNFYNPNFGYFRGAEDLETHSAASSGAGSAFSEGDLLKQ